jgi:hypothetical protein
LRLGAGLVAAGGVEGGVAEELAGGGVDDADVEVVDEQQDGLWMWAWPMPMWWRRPARRNEIAPVLSMRSSGW